ncbi:MAG: c-type cytochrome [Alphaproteobacteria bacterium]
MKRFKTIDIIGAVLFVLLFFTAIRVIGNALVSPEEEARPTAEAPAAPEPVVEAEAVEEAAPAPEPVVEAEAVEEAEPAPEPAAEVAAAAAEEEVAALAAGDPKAGAAVFKKHLCFACHRMEPGKHGVGPSLAGVWGREAAAVEGFKYSKALVDSGIVWTEENLDRWLTNPKAMVQGNKMILAKPVTDAGHRANLLAYLKEATGD